MQKLVPLVVVVNAIDLASSRLGLAVGGAAVAAIAFTLLKIVAGFEARRNGAKWGTAILGRMVA